MMNQITVMVISKDADLVRSVEDCLPSQDCRMVSTGEFGDSLKNVIKELHPDILLIDLVMPEMDGLDVCLQIRQWCPVPIILLTKWQTRKKDMVRGLDLSSYDYLSDPFHSSELAKRIGQALS